MPSKDILLEVDALSPAEQAAVLEFIQYLKARKQAVPAQNVFLSAADEFITEHPELLRRLAE